MVRLAIRQFRAQALVAVVALAVIGIVLAVIGAQLGHLYDTTVAECTANHDCPSVTVTFLSKYQGLQQTISSVLILTPAVVGVFWGAPLVARELENGTHRFVWTQGITRRRWLAAKVGVGALASMVVAGLVSLMVTWFFSPIDRVNMDQFAVFDERSVVPIGYAALAFAVGAVAGVLMRRTVPAMATSVVAFVAARLGIEFGVRPYLILPAHTSVALSATSNVGFGPDPSGAITFMAGDPTIPNAWVTSSQVVDSAGEVPSDQSLHQFLVGACPNIASPPTTGVGGHGPANQTIFQDCITQLSAKYHQAVTYQPPSRYWTFQWYETAIFVGLAVVLVGFCFWWVQRRLS